MFNLIRGRIRDMLSSQHRDEANQFFYYILDYTAASGHFSAPNEFPQYAEALRLLLQQRPVDFRAITYEKADTPLVTHYKDLMRRKAPAMTEPDLLNLVDKWLCNGNDAFVHYLNRGVDEHSARLWQQLCKLMGVEQGDGSVDQTASPKTKVYYQPYRKAPITLDGDAYPLANEIASLGSPQPDEDEYVLRPGRPGTYGAGTGMVVQHCEIGLTRFIVCNSFVISFVASRSTGRGAAEDVPAGYFSEDVVLIRRFRQAFEAYWDQLPQLLKQRAMQKQRVQKLQDHNAQLAAENKELAAQLQMSQEQVTQLQRSLSQSTGSGP